MISLEWLGLVPGCEYEAADHILSLLYIIFLIILVSILSVKYKNIKDNYNEAYSIFLLMILTVPVWISWISCSLLLPPVYTKATFGEHLQHFYFHLVCNKFFCQYYDLVSQKLIWHYFNLVSLLSVHLVTQKVITRFSMM